MFTKSIAALAAAAVLATASLSATTQANAGKNEALIAGAIIGTVIGIAAAKHGHAGEYRSHKRHDRYERKSWSKKRRNCDTVPVYEYGKYGKLYIVGYDKVCH